MEKRWEYLSRLANFLQISDVLPADWRGWVRWAIIGGGWALIRWMFGRASSLDPLYLWIGSAVLVTVLIWGLVGMRWLLAGTRLSMLGKTSSSKTIAHYVGLTQPSGLALFQVGSSSPLIECDFDAYLYFLECDETKQRKILEFMPYSMRGSRPRFTRRHFISVVDRKLALRMRFNDLIESANTLEDDLQRPRLPLGTDDSEKRVCDLELEAEKLLQETMPDRLGEYRSDVGRQPDDLSRLAHRVRARRERLIRFKEHI